MNIIIKPKGMVVLATLLSAGALLGVALPHFLAPRTAAPVPPKPLIHHLENPDFETVGADGKVTSAKVLKGAGHGFDEAALQGAKQIRFKPATVDGEAVSTEITYTMTFLLD